MVYFCCFIVNLSTGIHVCSEPKVFRRRARVFFFFATRRKEQRLVRISRASGRNVIRLNDVARNGKNDSVMETLRNAIFLLENPWIIWLGRKYFRRRRISFGGERTTAVVKVSRARPFRSRTRRGKYPPDLGWVASSASVVAVFPRGAAEEWPGNSIWFSACVQVVLAVIFHVFLPGPGNQIFAPGKQRGGFRQILNSAVPAAPFSVSRGYVPSVLPLAGRKMEYPDESKRERSLIF